jgi:hypothetical protein
MSVWAGVALALRQPEEDRLESRLPTYLHPLAGRPLLWHVLQALAGTLPTPRQLFTICSTPLGPELLAAMPGRALHPGDGSWTGMLAAQLDPTVSGVLLVAASAPTAGPLLGELIQGPANRSAGPGAGEPVAAFIDRARLVSGESLAALAGGLHHIDRPDACFAVRDRADLSRAVRTVRDRIVDRLMQEGVTFLLPESVLVDVDVAIGRDCVIYPGVVLEGNTSIGAETVIGPGCRIVDSRIGTGVELKGWNYVAGTNIRNRAVLEPYVRRGFA